MNHRVAAFGYRGGSLFRRRDFSMAAALVKHPKGDLLIDTGFGRNIDRQFGSIVVVPAFGHTPGSVITFVNLYNEKRYAFVGDIVWQLEGITQREERTWITRRRANTDAKANSENLRRMVALQERLPELIIVPAHDMRAFAEMPKLSPTSR